MKIRGSSSDEKARPVGPVRAAERLHFIDVLRGFAIFGILVVNMLGFSGASRGAYNLGWGDPLDRAFILASEFLIRAKFYSLFSFLFGWGIALQISRAQERNAPYFRITLRRLAVLLVIGVVHGTLLWSGDILTTYALLGFVLLLFHKRSGRVLLPAVGLLLLLAVLMVWPGQMMDRFHGWYNSLFSFLPGLPFGEEIFRTGTYGQIIQQRVSHYLRGQANIVYYFGNVLSMILLGFYAGKRRLFRDLEQHLTALRRTLIAGLVVGLALNGLFVTATLWLVGSWPSWPPAAYGQAVRVGARTFGAPALMLFYVALFITLYRREGWPGRLAPLGAVGRMALSNYLLQTVVATLIFFGYGLGLYGRVSPAFGLALTVIIFLGQIRFSQWWLERYRFGPAEWLWRSLTYGRWQPLRKGERNEPLWPARAWARWRGWGLWGYLALFALVAIAAVAVYQAVTRDEAGLAPTTAGGISATPTPILPAPTRAVADGQPLPESQPLPVLQPVSRDPSPAAARGDQVALAELFDVQAALAHIDTLTSAPYGGRAAGSPGGSMAADYIAGQFARFGLQPAGAPGSLGDETTFFQTFPIAAQALGESRLSIEHPDGRLIDGYLPHQDYAPLVGAYAGPGQATGPVIWVNRCGEEDFEGLDAVGAIVLCRPLSARDAGRQALERGAAGLLLLDSARPIDTLQPPGELWVPEALSIPTLRLSPAMVTDLLQPSGKTVADLSITFAPFELGSRATISVEVAGFESCPDGRCQGRNVLAVLPGRDPAYADQLIILGAHYDGLGQAPGVLWPGANDNASGVAALLEIARAWEESGFVPSRTVLFAAWDGGQGQALGAQAYTNQPWFPLAKTVAVLQLDGVGAGDDFLTVGGSGDLARSLELAATTAGYTTTVRDEWPGDHLPFLEAGVPANTLTWLGEMWGTVAGQPGDSLQAINPERLAAAGRIAGLALLGVSEGEPALTRLLNQRAQAAANQDAAAFLSSSSAGRELFDRHWLAGLGSYDLLRFQIQASELAVAGDLAKGKVVYTLAYQTDSDDGQPGEVISETLSASLDGQFAYGEGGWAWAGADLTVVEGQGNLAVALPPGETDSAGSVLAAIEDQYQTITALMGLEDRSQATVYFYASPQSLRADVDLSLTGSNPSWVEPGAARLLYSNEITQSSRLSAAISKLVLAQAGLTEAAAPWLWNGLEPALQEVLNPAAGPAYSLAELRGSLENPEPGDRETLAWAAVDHLRRELGWSGLGQLLADLGERCAGRCQELADLDGTLMATLGIDATTYEVAWRTAWIDRLETIRAGLERTLTQRAEAILARDLPSFMAAVDNDQPFLTTEEERFFEDLARYPATAFSLEATPLRLADDGSVLAMVDRAYEFGGRRGNERFPILFRPQGDRLLWAGAPFEQLDGQRVALLYPAGQEETAQELLALAEELSARIAADLDLEGPALLVAGDAFQEVTPRLTIKLYPGLNSYRSSLPPSLPESELSRGWTAGDSSIKLLLDPEIDEGALRSGLIHQLTRQRLLQVGLEEPWLVEGLTIHQAVRLHDRETERWLAESLRVVWRDTRRGNGVSLVDVPPQSELTERQWRAFMAQAWDLVRYIEDTFGHEALLQLIRARAAGGTVDSALDQALGLDLASLEAAWAESSRQGHLPDRWIDLVNRFDIELAQEHLAALTSPEMAGRQSGSPGAEAASAYIAGAFAEYGLLPAGDDPGSGPTYFQRFPADYAGLVEAPQVTILDPAGDATASLIHRQDLLTTFDQVVAWGEATGELVYIRDFDYGQMDLTGKIVLREPERALSVEVAEAVEHGAAGILFLSDLDYERGQLVKSTLPLTLTGAIETPALLLTLAGSNQIFEAAGHTLVSLRAGPSALPLGFKVQVQVPLSRPEPVEMANILGYLPGADPALAGEVIVVGAHYDHVGDDPDLVLCESDTGTCQASPGLRYPGLNDNASGLAALLEIARLWSEGGYRPARTVLFAAWIGQEAGQAGSTYYAEHPAFPLEETVVAIQLDSLGGGRGFRVDGQGEWEREGRLLLILELTEELLEGRVRISPPSTTVESDDRPFREQDIPSLLISWQDADETNLPESLDDEVEPERLAIAGRVAALVLMSAAGGG